MPEIESGMYLAKSACYSSHVLVTLTKFQNNRPWVINLCFEAVDAETPISTLMDFEGPFSDIPLFEDYLRITNRSEQPSTGISGCWQTIELTVTYCLIACIYCAIKQVKTHVTSYDVPVVGLTVFSLSVILIHLNTVYLISCSYQ